MPEKPMIRQREIAILEIEEVIDITRQRIARGIFDLPGQRANAVVAVDQNRPA